MSASAPPSAHSLPPLHLRLDTEAFRTLAGRLPDRGRVLDLGLGDGGAALLAFRSLGFEATAVAAERSPHAETAEARWGSPVRDLRMASLPRETYDGIWCHRTLQLYPLDHVQRVLILAFSALKPKTGMALFSFLGDAPHSSGGMTSTSVPAPESPPSREHPESALIRSEREYTPERYSFTENAFLSLLRQSGFQALSRGELREPGGAAPWIAVLARRV
jgi:hypothetical protein